MGFVKDIKLGGKAEEFVRSILATANIPSSLNTSKKKTLLEQWDIKATVDGREFLIECKFDIYESKSGNVAVEYYNTKLAKASGLMATTAELWVFVLDRPMTAWVCRVSDLKDYFLNRPCLRNIACGGDKNSAMKLFVRTKIFSDIFTQIDNLPTNELENVLDNLLK